ncbi:MAG: DUF4145 domain-containing protein [Dehalococcoidia bacterium]|nr:DUF4145 domain-containing protein [Dehalococcoidia bacterium]
MICPFCSFAIPELWQPLAVITDPHGKPVEQAQYTIHQRRDKAMRTLVDIVVRWMKCPNESCGHVIVKVWRSEAITPNARDTKKTYEEWFAVPRKRAPRPIDSLVPQEIRDDYLEASLILEDSPRMSAVLSRRVLADLLKKYAECNERQLDDQIKSFENNQAYPTALKENLHYLREIGNFGAHSQEDDEGKIIDVSAEEANWTLEVLDGLLDYLIIGPARDAERRSIFDEKIKAAKRRPLKETK